MISDKFTVEDIHKIRYESFEKRKNMNAKELIEDTKRGAEEGKRIMAELKNRKKTTTINLL